MDTTFIGAFLCLRPSRPITLFCQLYIPPPQVRKSPPTPLCHRVSKEIIDTLGSIMKDLEKQRREAEAIYVGLQRKNSILSSQQYSHPLQDTKSPF